MFTNGFGDNFVNFNKGVFPIMSNTVEEQTSTGFLATTEGLTTLNKGVVVVFKTESILVYILQTRLYRPVAEKSINKQ